MAKHEKNQAKSLDRIARSLEAAQPGGAARDTSKPDRSEKLPIMARVILAIGSSDSGDRRSAAARRSFPIRGYVGPNGGGKSLAMVRDVLPSLAAGRTVLSTVKLLDARTGLPHSSYVPFSDFDQLLDLSHADVLMDEIVGVANSRDANRLPSQIQNVLVQLRRRDLTLSWSAPNWARSDKIIREVTQAVTECRGYYPARAQQAATDSGVRLWAPKRVFKFRTYDTAEFEEWTAGKRDKIKAVVAQWYKGVGSEAFASYDTLDAVSMVGYADGEDRCAYCDKKKRVELCKGHTEQEIHDFEHAAEEPVPADPWDELLSPVS